MLKYKHILLATDLSANAEKIAQHAKMISENSSHAKISIVHVVEHTPIVYGGGEFSIPLDINLEEVLKENAKQALAHLAKKIDVNEKDQYIEMGSIKNSIIHLAEKIGVDLIVVGTHKHHGLEKLLGSTANAVLHGAACDVWTIRTE